MEELLEMTLSKMIESGAYFCDVHYQRISDLNIRSLNGVLRDLSDKSMEGLVCRSWRNGRWGFASTTKLDKKSVKEAALKAVKNSTISPISDLLLKPKENHHRMKAEVKIHPCDVPLEEKVAAVLDLDASQKMDKINNRVASYVEELKHNHVLNSQGTDVYWEEVRTRFRAMSIASDGSRLERYYEGPDSSLGFETVKNTDITALGRKTAEEAIKSLSSVKAPSGKMIVISDPMVTGLLAHEVMGHASEADEVVKGRSFLTNKVGKKVGSELVTLVDDGSIKGAHGYIPFDDEGTPSSRTSVIEDGIYKSFIHNLETAQIMNVNPTGNGRCENFGRRNWVRMTNTFIEAGDWNIESMIEDVRHGILCEKMINGMEDPVGGGFEAKVLRGYLIENGRIGAMLRSFTLTGQALEILGTVDAVGNKSSLDGGYCGKGIEDWVPVSSGGPHLRSQMIVGGG